MSRLCKHDQTCMNCSTDHIVLLRPEEDREPEYCPVCGSALVTELEEVQPEVDE